MLPDARTRLRPTSRRHATVIGVALAIAAAGLPAAPAAQAASSCTYSASAGRQMGASYVTSIAVTRVNCTNAIAVVKAFHACRKSHGGAKNGRCPSSTSIRGFRCSEKRGKTYQKQFSSKVTCRQGAANVVHTYSNFV